MLGCDGSWNWKKTRSPGCGVWVGTVSMYIASVYGVSFTPESRYTWATKDEQGRMILVRQVGGGTTVVAWSRDEGETWEEG